VVSPVAADLDRNLSGATGSSSHLVNVLSGSFEVGRLHDHLLFSLWHRRRLDSSQFGDAHSPATHSVGAPSPRRLLISLLTGLERSSAQLRAEPAQAIANVEKTARLAGALGGSLIQLVQQRSVLGVKPFRISTQRHPARIDLAVQGNMASAGGMVWTARRTGPGDWSITVETPAPIDFTSTNAGEEALAVARRRNVVGRATSRTGRSCCDPHLSGCAVSASCRAVVPSSSDDVVRSLFWNRRHLGDRQ
jgi:hypothetical protein